MSPGPRLSRLTCRCHETLSNCRHGNVPSEVSFKKCHGCWGASALSLSNRSHPLGPRNMVLLLTGLWSLGGEGFRCRRLPGTAVNPTGPGGVLRQPEGVQAPLSAPALSTVASVHHRGRAEGWAAATAQGAAPARGCDCRPPARRGVLSHRNWRVVNKTVTHRSRLKKSPPPLLHPAPVPGWSLRRGGHLSATPHEPVPNPLPSPREGTRLYLLQSEQRGSAGSPYVSTSRGSNVAR